MKFLGIVILGASVIAIGFLLSGCYKSRRRALDSAQQLVLFLESEICFSGKDLGEIIKARRKRNVFPPFAFSKTKAFLRKCVNRSKGTKKLLYLRKIKKF